MICGPEDLRWHIWGGKGWKWVDWVEEKNWPNFRHEKSKNWRRKEYWELGREKIGEGQGKCQLCQNVDKGMRQNSWKYAEIWRNEWIYNMELSKTYGNGTKEEKQKEWRIKCFPMFNQCEQFGQIE